MMSTARHSDTIIRGNIDNSDLLVELRRERYELTAELRRIDTNLRRIGTSDRLQKTYNIQNANNNGKANDDSSGTSAAIRSNVGHPKHISNERQNSTNKRKNFESSNSESITSDDDNSYDGRRPSRSSHGHSSKTTILSSVVTLPTTQEDISKQRIEAIQVRQSDTKGLARNKRMFGMILGTLEKFQTEESNRLELTQKRSRIERKLEIAVEEEKAVAIEERDKLIADKLIKQERLDNLDLKLDKLQRHENWELSHKNLGNFIKTDVKPCIFWLPRLHTVETEKKLRESRDYYKLYVAERRAKVKKELEFIEKQFETSDEDQSVSRKIEGDNNSNNFDMDLNGTPSEGGPQATETIRAEVGIVKQDVAPSIIGLELKDPEPL